MSKHLCAWVMDKLLTRALIFSGMPKPSSRHMSIYALPDMVSKNMKS